MADWKLMKWKKGDYHFSPKSSQSWDHVSGVAKHLIFDRHRWSESRKLKLKLGEASFKLWSQLQRVYRNDCIGVHPGLLDKRLKLYWESWLKTFWARIQIGLENCLIVIFDPTFEECKIGRGFTKFIQALKPVTESAQKRLNTLRVSWTRLNLVILLRKLAKKLLGYKSKYLIFVMCWCVSISRTYPGYPWEKMSHSQISTVLVSLDPHTYLFTSPDP